MNPALEQLTEQFTRLIGTGASQFSDMGGTPMPRGTGVPPVGLQKTEIRPVGAIPAAPKIIAPVVAPAAAAVVAAPAVATGTPVPAAPPPPSSPVQTVNHALKGYDFEATVASGQVVAAAEILDEHGFALDTITGVDWLAQGEMEVVYDFFHPTSPLRAVVRTRVPRANPELPTILNVFPGANWHERETHDFFGIRFSGHPNLKPFLLPEDADFHPLRKDYQP